MSELRIKDEITPSQHRCIGGSCPGVYILDDGNLLIIAKKAPHDLHQQVEHKIAEDELAVVISPDFFENL